MILSLNKEIIIQLEIIIYMDYEYIIMNTQLWFVNHLLKLKQHFTVLSYLLN